MTPKISRHCSQRMVAIGTVVVLLSVLGLSLAVEPTEATGNGTRMGSASGYGDDGGDICQMPSDRMARSMIQTQALVDPSGVERSPIETQTVADCPESASHRREVFLQVGAVALSSARLDDHQEPGSVRSSQTPLAATTNASEALEKDGSITMQVNVPAPSNKSGSAALNTFGTLIQQVRVAQIYQSRSESLLLLALGVVGCMALSLIGCIVFFSKSDDDALMFPHDRSSQKGLQSSREASILEQMQNRPATADTYQRKDSASLAQRSPLMQERTPAEQGRAGRPPIRQVSRTESPRSSMSPARQAELAAGMSETGGAQRVQPGSRRPPSLPPTARGAGTPPRSPVSAGRTLRSTSPVPVASEGHMQSTSGGSAGPASLLVSRQLCPDLVVPKGSECIMAVPSRSPGSTTPMPASFSIRELSGAPVIHVQLSPQEKAGGAGSSRFDTHPIVQLSAAQGAQRLIAYCKASTESAGRRSVYVYDAANALVGPVTKVMTLATPRGGDVARPCYVLTSGRMGIQWLLEGDFRQHAVRITGEKQRRLADTEPSTMKFDTTGTYYKLRVTECVDVGLVLCALLSIDLLEDLC